MTRSRPAGAPVPARQCAQLLYVLALLQVGFDLVAGAGQALGAGTLLYLVMPAAGAVLRVLAAGSVLRGRRWGLVALTVLACADLAAFGLSAALGLLPALDHSVTLMGLLDGIALPAIVLGLCGELLSSTPRAAHAATGTARSAAGAAQASGTRPVGGVR